MKERDFVKKIFYTTLCENCPIHEYCKIAVTITCTETARQYYRTHGKESIKWEMLVNFQQRFTTPNF